MDIRNKFYCNNLRQINGISFTIRQVDIMACILCNRGDKKIAQLLDLSPKTVSSHIRSILLILGGNSREYIIDFIEKSGKIRDLRKYYTHILIESLFLEYLTKIQNFISDDKIVHIENYNHLINKNEQEIFNQLIIDLNTIGIILNKNQKEKEESQISDLHILTPNTNIFNPKNIYCLFDKNLNTKNLTIKFIDFSNEQFYHLSVFNLIEKIIKQPDLAEVIREFESKYLAIMDSWSGDSSNSKSFFTPKIWNKKIKIKKYFYLIFAALFVMQAGYFVFYREIIPTNFITEKNRMANKALKLEPWNMPYIPEYFIERKSISKKINTKLEEFKSRSGLNLLGLYGLGGVGKTYLALNAIYNPVKNYKFRGWFTASDENKIKADYLKLGYELGLFPYDIKEKYDIKEESKIECVKEWLANQQDILLVFDNAPNIEIIKQYFPKKGDIIITSRNPKLVGAIEVDIMKDEESVNLLKELVGKRENSNSDDEYKKLANILGNFPLAISQAGAFIEEREINISKYLQLYQTEQNTILSQNIMPALDPHAPAYVSWSIILSEIKEKDPSGEAIELLRLCSLCHFVDMPKELLIYYLYGNINNKTELKFYNLANFLKQYSLLKITEENISIHHLIQDYIISNMTPQYQEQLFEKIINTLKYIYPLGQHKKEDYRLIKKLLPHIRSFLKQSRGVSDFATRQLTMYLADANFIMSNYQDAKNLFQASLTKSNNYSDKIDVMDDIYVQIGIAIANLMLGEYKEAELLLNHLLNKTNSIEYKYSILDHLGRVYLELGYYKESEKVLKKSLILKKTINNTENHINTAFTFKFLAKLYVLMGKYKEAKFLAEKALNIEKNYYGGYKNAKMFSTLRYLARAMLELGDYAKAEELLKLAISIQKDYNYGEDVHIGFLHKHLGIVYTNLGQYDKAKELLDKTYNLFIKHYGAEDHIDIIHLKNRIGALYLCQKQYSKAKEILEEVLIGKIKHYKNDQHINLFGTLRNIANVEIQLGNYAKAEELLNKIIKVQYENYGTSHLQIMSTLSLFAELAYKNNQIEKARFYIDEAEKIFKNHQDLAPEHIALKKFTSISNMIKRPKILNQLFSWYFQRTE